MTDALQLCHSPSASRSRQPCNYYSQFTASSPHSESKAVTHANLKLHPSPTFCHRKASQSTAHHPPSTRSSRAGVASDELLIALLLILVPTDGRGLLLLALWSTKRVVIYLKADNAGHSLARPPGGAQPYVAQQLLLIGGLLSFTLTTHRNGAPEGGVGMPAWAGQGTTQYTRRLCFAFDYTSNHSSPPLPFVVDITYTSHLLHSTTETRAEVSTLTNERSVQALSYRSNT